MGRMILEVNGWIWCLENRSDGSDMDGVVLWQRVRGMNQVVLNGQRSGVGCCEGFHDC